MTMKIRHCSPRAAVERQVVPLLAAPPLTFTTPRVISFYDNGECLCVGDASKLIISSLSALILESYGTICQQIK